jgi:hypothetical protein
MQKMATMGLRKLLFFIGGAVLTFAIQQFLEDFGVHFDDLAASCYRWLTSHASLIVAAFGGLALLVGSAFLPPGFTYLHRGEPASSTQKRRSISKAKAKSRSKSIG